MAETNAVGGEIPSSESIKKDHIDVKDVIMNIDPGWITVPGKKWRQPAAAGDVLTFNADYIGILDGLRKLVQQQGTDLTGIDLSEEPHDYLSQLRTTGRAAYMKFLPPDARKYIEDKDAEAIRDNQRLLLNITSEPELPLFWSMLYSGEPGGTVQTDRFWGFRYPLGHMYLLDSSVLIEKISTGNGILSAIHEDLLFSRQEVEQLAKLVAHASEHCGIKITLQLLEQLIPLNNLTEDTFLDLLTAEDFGFGVIHFACHCEHLTVPVSRSQLLLKMQTKPLNITLKQLMGRQEPGFQHHPFIFLNACESETVGDLLGTTRFPTELLNLKAGGVIATACIIPDNFASEFAHEFYRLLLLRLGTGLSASLADVLWETKRHFLDRYNNPLGLAYNLHALASQKMLIGGNARGESR